MLRGGGALKVNPLEEREFRVLMTSNWLSFEGSYWLGLLLGKIENLPLS